MDNYLLVYLVCFSSLSYISSSIWFHHLLEYRGTIVDPQPSLRGHVVSYFHIRNLRVYLVVSFSLHHRELGQQIRYKQRIHLLSSIVLCINQSN
jgi:hypothetical protein